MANLDTRSKRASSVGILLVSVLAPPLPDGAITALGDRQHIAWEYSGIEAASADVPDHEVVYWRGTSDATVTWLGQSHATVVWRGESDATESLTGDV